jgi:DNA primase
LLLKTGLVANRNDQLMDNYRGRINFPVHNHSGKVLGLGKDSEEQMIKRRNTLILPKMRSM